MLVILGLKLVEHRSDNRLIVLKTILDKVSFARMLISRVHDLLNELAPVLLFLLLPTLIKVLNFGEVLEGLLFGLAHLHNFVDEFFLRDGKIGVEFEEGAVAGPDELF